MTWLARAEVLAEDARDLGTQGAVLNAAAWAARVDPEATKSLITASLILNPDVGPLMWSPQKPLENDNALVNLGAELAVDVDAMLNRLKMLATSVQNAWQQASEDLQRARRNMASGNPAIRAAAAGAADDAIARAGDCAAALDVLDATGARLDRGAKHLAYLPDELAAAYETPYALIATGGQLPHSGDFITGQKVRG